MIKLKEICYIVGAAADKIPCSTPFINENDFLIAADGGLKVVSALNLKPNLCIGDFDSLGYKPKGENIIEFASEKNETDTFLAYLEGKKRNFDTFVIFGGIGGTRIDHTIANIQMLEYIAKRGEKALLVDDGVIITAVNNDTIKIPKKKTGYVSIFCLGNDSCDVKISGLKYELDNINLKSEFPLGVSNEFIDKPAEIEAKNGTILLICFDSAKNFKDYL